jgi:uncharacterized protein (DUF885 family)
MLEDSARQIENSKGQRPDGERLHALFALHWTYTLDEYPELATYTGDPGRNHRWTDHSLEAYERRNREMEIPARVLATIDRAALGAADQVHTTSSAATSRSRWRGAASRANTCRSRRWAASSRTWPST